MLFSVSRVRFLKDEKSIKSKPIWKLKHANSILVSFEYFCQMPSISILIILNYTVSKLVDFSKTQCRPIITALTDSIIMIKFLTRNASQLINWPYHNEESRCLNYRTATDQNTRKRASLVPSLDRGWITAILQLFYGMSNTNFQRLQRVPNAVARGPAKSRNPRNPPPISRNPHAKKRNPTAATKSTATPPKANYRNPPALDREPRFLRCCR